MGLGPELAASAGAITTDANPTATTDKVGLNRLKKELDAKLDAKLAQHKRRQAARDRVASANENHLDDSAAAKLSSVTRTAFMVVLHRRQLKVYLAEKSTDPLLVVEAAEEMHGDYFVGFTAATGTQPVWADGCVVCFVCLFPRPCVSHSTQHHTRVHCLCGVLCHCRRRFRRFEDRFAQLVLAVEQQLDSWTLE
jgi:hypothetical protein